MISFFFSRFLAWIVAYFCEEFFPEEIHKNGEKSLIFTTANDGPTCNIHMCIDCYANLQDGVSDHIPWLDIHTRVTGYTQFVYQLPLTVTCKGSVRGDVS